MSCSSDTPDEVSNFYGGRIKDFSIFWNDLTSDQYILDCVEGIKLNFNMTPFQFFVPNEISCSLVEKEEIEAELSKYLEKSIIELVEHSPGEFISQIFRRPKRSGGLRIILNLSKLNEFIPYEHFKMETFNSVVSLVEPNCFMSSIDLTDAYFSVNINSEFRKFLKFSWNGNLYQFTCMPNGLACAPRIFTKILKPLYAKLRSEGLVSVYYLDDSWLMGSSAEDCSNNVERTEFVLSKAGFIINEKKSVKVPTTKITFLGFEIDSVNMTISLPLEKKVRIINFCKEILLNPSLSIRKLAEFIGILVSSFPAIQYGELFYRFLEHDKVSALKREKGNFDAMMEVNDNSINEIKWWLNNISSAYKLIRIQPFDLVLTTDASPDGWGAVVDNSSTGGHWTDTEKEAHINVLELKAIYFGLKCYFYDYFNKHIRIKSDNTTAVAYINNFGGCRSLDCHNIAKEIWLWAFARNLHLSAEHLPGDENTLADKASRVFDIKTEWELSNSVFSKLVHIFGNFEIDLFASRLNKKLPTYVAWKPDPDALFIDAFSNSWARYLFYAFPPFSVIQKCLQKILEEEATGLIVVPVWQTQSWFPKLMKMLVKPPVLLPLNILSLPFSKEKHKQDRCLRLMACYISGNTSKSEVFRRDLLKSCCPHGEGAQGNNMKYILKSGIISVLGDKEIPCILMKI